MWKLQQWQFEPFFQSTVNARHKISKNISEIYIEKGSIVQ